jgi:hypothetical protein
MREKVHCFTMKRHAIFTILFFSIGYFNYGQLKEKKFETIKVSSENGADVLVVSSGDTGLDKKFSEVEINRLFIAGKLKAPANYNWPGLGDIGDMDYHRIYSRETGKELMPQQIKFRYTLVLDSAVMFNDDSIGDYLVWNKLPPRLIKIYPRKGNSDTTYKSAGNLNYSDQPSDDFSHKVTTLADRYGKLVKLKVNGKYGIYSMIKNKWLLENKYDQIEIGSFDPKIEFSFFADKNFSVTCFIKGKKILQKQISDL